MHSCIKSFEEIFCQRFGRPVDQALPQLGHLSANRGLHRITQGMSGPFGRQLHLGAPLAVTGRAALPLKTDGVALGGIDIRKDNFPGEFGGDRTDLERHTDGIGILAGGLYLVAAGNALLEHVGIIERLPGLLLGDGQFAATLHFHCQSFRYRFMRCPV